MEYKREEKRRIFNTLPDDLREAIISVETADKLKLIADKHSLMIDQIGELGDELGLFMLGLTKQADFVKNVAKRLNISIEASIEIARDINTEIIDAVRISLQKIQEKHQEFPPAAQAPQTPETPPTFTARTFSPTPPPPRPSVQRKPIYQNLPETPKETQKPNLSSLERAGDFTIEQKPVSNSPQYNHTTLSRDDVLREIEDVDHMIGIKNEASFVDHLLAQSNEQPKQSTPPIPKKPIPEVPKYTKDPYREEF